MPDNKKQIEYLIDKYHRQIGDIGYNIIFNQIQGIERAILEQQIKDYSNFKKDLQTLLDNHDTPTQTPIRQAL